MDNFFTNFRAQAINEKIVKGDTVKVIGRDEYKGWVGIVITIEEMSGDPIYVVELQANSKKIERYGESLRKEFEIKN